MPLSLSSRTLLMSALALGMAASASAQTAHDPHAGHSMPAAKSAPAGAAAAPSTVAYEAASQRMHQGMAIPYTGDADVDFVRGMIAHHQGAIDMARVQLKYGQDPALKKLSEEIIAAQEKEVGFLMGWLAKRQPAGKR